MSDAESNGSTGVRMMRGALRRWLGGGALLLGIFYVVGMGAVRGLVDAEMLERRLNPVLASATADRYRVAVDAVEWGLWIRSLRVEGVQLRPQSAGEGNSARIGDLSIRALQFGGIDLWALVGERALRLNEIVVQRPRVALQSPASTAPPSPTDRDTTTRGAALTDLRIHEVRVEEGRLTRTGAEGALRDSLWDVSAEFGELSLDSMNAAPTAKDYFAHRFRAGGFGGYRHYVNGRPYVLRLGEGQVSRRDSSLRVTDVHFVPTVEDEAFMNRHRYRVNRFRTRAEQVAVSGLDVRRLRTEGDVYAASVRVDDWTLDVYRDNHRPESPTDPPPPMPHEAVERLDRSVRIDTLRLRRSHIEYTKRPEDIPKTGSIRFHDLWASGYNLTNDPARMTPATPAVVDVRTRVNDDGPLQVRFRIPLRAPHLNLSFRGRLGPTDPQALNDPFVPLGGVRIESGTVDSLWFRADVEQGTATGSVGAVYRDLEIETLDAATGDRGLGARIKTTVAGLALRNDNHPAEGPLHEGEIQHTRSPEDSFFKFLWHAVRDGIYSLVGIDRLPR